MPFTILSKHDTAENTPPNYKGTPEEAKGILQSLEVHLKNPDGSIKSGVLKLVPLKDGSGYQLPRMKWWNPFHSRNKEEMERTAQFIQSLLAAACSEESKKTNESEKTIPPSGDSNDSSSLRVKALKNFTRYVERKNSYIGTKRLATLLSSSEWSASGSVPARWNKHRIVNLWKAIKSDPYSILFGKNSTPAEVFEKRYQKEITHKIKEGLVSFQDAKKELYTIIKVRSKWGLDYYAFPPTDQDVTSEMKALSSADLIVEEVRTSEPQASSPRPSELSQRSTMVTPYANQSSASLSSRATEVIS